MTKETREILERALKLPYEEREKLTQQLRDSLDDEGAADPEAVKKAWAGEIKRRVREIEDGKVEGTSHAEVMREFRKRFGKPKSPKSK